MLYEIVSPVRNAQTITTGTLVRDRGRLRRFYGRGRWRKRKGEALVRLPDGVVTMAEVHWYEASEIGKKKLKVRRLFWD